MVDDEVPAGEIRVTVIATGLERDQDRVRPRDDRSRSRGERELISDQVQIDHIESIHPDGLEPVTRMEQVRSPADTRPDSLDSGGLSGEFESPFEDELETPTFLRRAQD